MQEGRDPRVNWELGWKAIKKTLRQIKWDRDGRERNRERREDHLYDLHMNLGMEPEEEQLRRLVEITEEV